MRPRILATLVLLLPLLLAAGCGDDAPVEPTPGEALALEQQRLAAAEKSRAAAEAAAFTAAIDAALELVHQSDLPAARRAADAAGLLPGADRDQVKALRTAIEADQTRIRTREDSAAVRLLILERVTSEDPIKRAEHFETLASGIRDYLVKYPDAKNAEEIEAGAAFNEEEARKHRTYVESLAAARVALKERRFDDAIQFAERAYAALPFDEARSMRQKAVRKAAPRGMVLVPGGPAPVGRKKHQTVVAPFYIDKTEVSCREYALFLVATGHGTPGGWGGTTPPKGKEDHPVNRITGADAAAYAKWAGKRLPTETEWEKAARGPDGRIFPWGDDWDARAGNFDNKGTAPVGGTPGDFSYYGLLDMGGNVAEFTVPVLPFPKGSLPVAPENRPRWSVKGGHWASGGIPEDNASFLRFPFRADTQDTGTGFRCAKSAR